MPAVTAPSSLVNSWNENSLTASGSAAGRAVGHGRKLDGHAPPSSLGAVGGVEVFDVAQLGEAEGVAVAHLQGAHPADRRVADDEAVPLPGHRRDAEQVADRHRVGAGVGDERDPPVGAVDLPQREVAVETAHASLLEPHGAAEVDAVDEVAG